MSNLVEQQKEVCRRFSADYEALELDLMVGISKNFLSGVLPLNGLRHPQEGQSCGWFLWAGEEFSEAPDFFEVWHAHHLVGRRPDVAKYLGLGPGWRFLIAFDYEDVWFDSKLLRV
jgi:hypothetical protein